MKTIVRISDALDSPEQIGDARLSSFALAMLAEGFDKRRSETPEALLIVQKASKGPVYITVGPHPPELVAGSRQVYGVFCPADSQEPYATFSDQAKATRWAEVECEEEGFVVRAIDATDRVGIRPCVAVVIHNAAGQALYVRLAKTGQWTIPEGDLRVGESVESAARRAVAELGLEIGPLKMPAHVPYINVVFPELGHYLSLIVVTTAKSDPSRRSDRYDTWTWGSPTEPPQPQFVTVATIRKLATQKAPSTASAQAQTPEP